MVGEWGSIAYLRSEGRDERVNRRKLLAKARNNLDGLRFSDLVLLVEWAGFTLRGGEGSHHVYLHPDVPEILGIQRGRDGKAKAYQVRQFLTVFDEHGLSPE